MEGVEGEERIDEYQDVLYSMMRGEPGAGFPGGDSRESVLARTRPVLEGLAGAHGDRDVALVSHGGACRFMATAAAGIDPDWAIAHRLPNCTFIVLEPRGKPFGSWQMTRWDTEERKLGE